MTAQERQDFDQAFLRANPIWAKMFRETGPVSPLGRAAFQQFAVERLLDPAQRDLVAFARDRGAPIEVVNLLQAAV